MHGIEYKRQGFNTTIHLVSFFLKKPLSHTVRIKKHFEKQTFKLVHSWKEEQTYEYNAPKIVFEVN